MFWRGERTRVLISGSKRLDFFLRAVCHLSNAVKDDELFAV